MPTQEAIVGVIYAAIDEYNEMHPPDEQLEKSPSTVLLGESSKLFSLGLINLIVAVEQKIDEKLGLKLSLVDEFLEAVERDPISDVGALARYIATRSA